MLVADHYLDLHPGVFKWECFIDRATLTSLQYSIITNNYSVFRNSKYLSIRRVFEHECYIENR